MKTKERGITLIALVVTIIVLLILAGVSIQMLAGQSGILKNAQQAREETEKGQIKDNVQREILEKMTEKYGEDLTADELYEILGKYFEGVPAPGEEEEDPWNAEDFPASLQLHSREGDYTFNLGDIYSGTLSRPKAGDIVPIPENKKEKGWEESKVNPTVDEKGKVIPVPKDFHYVEGAESGTVGGNDNIGVVIADNNGNEFVWIPVPKAIADGETSKAETTVELGGFKSTTTPMAEQLEDEKYRGILYQSWNISTKKVTNRQYSETGYREPATVDSDSSKELTLPELQEEYKKMIESVDKYGGFYVARYEMSLNGTNAEYKKDKPSASAAPGSANTWYGLYDKQKEFATANKYTSVESSMIWGSQYDAMMNWMARCGLDITSNKIVPKNETETTGGPDDKDVLNNIYDLLGCHWEWTLEAIITSSRAGRGRQLQRGFS